jgi:hypothetical protein
MSHRKRERPVERLRSALTSVADLEETLAGMFAPPVNPEENTAPAFIGGLNSGASKVGAPELTAPSLHGQESTPLFSAAFDAAPDKLSAVGAPILGAPLLGGLPIRSHEPAPQNDNPDIMINEFGAPKVGAPILKVSADPSPETAEVHDDAAMPADTPGAPTLSAPEFDLEPFAFRRARPLLREAVTAQDGHTHGEQALFATLWRLAKPIGKGTNRALNIGERTLAGEVPMAYSTAQENTRSLVRKLAIDVQCNAPNKPKTYFVYSYEEILKRRRAAGLTHILRRTSGVALVNPLAPTVGAPSFGAPISTSGAPSFKSSSAPNLTAHIRNSKEDLGTTASTAPSVIVNAIINAFGFVDDQAILTIVRECRKRAPDATDDEIAEISSWQCRRISRLRNVDNPVGLLINQVPRCFEGEPFARYRREKVEAAKRFEQQMESQT